MPPAATPCGRTAEAEKRSSCASELTKTSSSSSAAGAAPISVSPSLSAMSSKSGFAGNALGTTRLTMPARVPSATGRSLERSTSASTFSLRSAMARYSPIFTPAASCTELVGIAGSSNGLNRISRPLEVTAPISLRLEVSTRERMASCLLRLLGGVSVISSAPSGKSTRAMRPLELSSTVQATSASSRFAPLALLARAVTVPLPASVRTVRRGVAKRSAVSASSLETAARIAEGLASSFSRAAISARKLSRSVSSSIRENLVKRRSRNSRM